MESLLNKFESVTFSANQSSNGLLTIISKISDNSIKFHGFKSLIKLLIAAATKRNFRLIIPHTPIKDFVFHTMARLNEVTCQMFCWDCNPNTFLCSMSSNVMFWYVLIFLIIEMSQRNLWGDIMEDLDCLVIERLDDYREIHSFTLIFSMKIVFLKNIVNLL